MGRFCSSPSIYKVCQFRKELKKADGTSLPCMAKESTHCMCPYREKVPAPEEPKLLQLTKPFINASRR